MIGIPINPNSVYVSMVQTECCKSEFDTTYPIHLNGIISQGEYIESIDKINRSFGSNRKFIFLPLISFFIMICLIVIIIPLVVTTTHSSSGVAVVPAVMGVSFGIFFLMIILTIVFSFRRVARLRQAIAEESAKYSSRSTPCSWRLETTRYFSGGYGNNNTTTSYHIIIDIGRPMTIAYNNNESAYLVGQQNAYAAPPSYYTASDPTCTQCGAIRNDRSARFCSSCGQAFKY